MFTFATANIEPGALGKSGEAGSVGKPGNQGSGGNANGFCGEGPAGNTGYVPVPPDYGQGTKGLPGSRGERLNRVRDNSDLF